MTAAADLYGPTRLPNAELADGMVPVFIYAVKSSPDDKDAISTQLKRCFAAIAAEGGRQLLARPFTEDNASGFTSERGDELDAAMEAAIKAADEHGHAELWVWHSSRFARGDGTKGRRSLTTVWAYLRYKGVTLRSALDDDDIRTETGTAQASVQHNKYSANLSMWIRDGKDRMRDAGRYLGGSCPDGYAQETRADGTKGPRFLDDQRVPTIKRMFELGKSLGDSATARKLNAEGHRRKSGKLWNADSVHRTLVNPHYAGRYKQRDGTSVPAIVSDADFDAAQVLRPGGPRTERRDAQGNPPPRKRRMPKGGRNTDRYILAKIARCARCGGTMYGHTSPYRRSDGTHAQNYVCSRSSAYRSVDATCDAPKVNVQAVDAAIIPHLRGFFVDFRRWLAEVTRAQRQEREGVAAQIAESRSRLDKLATAHDRAHERYVAALADPDAETARIEAMEGALSKIASDRAQTEASIAELDDALAELDAAGSPTDAMLDHWNSVSASIQGAIDDANGNVGEINARLRHVLDRVEIDTLPDGRIRMLAVFSRLSGRGQWVPKVNADYEPMFDQPADFFPDEVDIYASPRLAPGETPFSAAVPGREAIHRNGMALT